MVDSRVIIKPYSYSTLNQNINTQILWSCALLSVLLPGSHTDSPEAPPAVLPPQLSSTSPPSTASTLLEKCTTTFLMQTSPSMKRIMEKVFFANNGCFTIDTGAFTGRSPK